MNVLEILKAKKYDHGEVKVLARNYVGSQEHTVSLTVKEPFDFRSKLHPSDNTGKIFCLYLIMNSFI